MRSPRSPPNTPRPHLREGQKRLAAEATRIVHGDEGVAAAIKTTEVLFGSEPFTDLPAAIVREAFADAPSVEVPRRLISDGLPVHKFLVEAQACASQLRRNAWSVRVQCA